MELNDRAANVGTALLDTTAEWISEDDLATATGETGYAVRWYIYQLREAGYVVESARAAARISYREGARGYRLIDIQDEPYRPTNNNPPVVQIPGGIRIGTVVEHDKFGRGKVTFAGEGAPKVVVKFGRKKYAERVEREQLLVLQQ